MEPLSAAARVEAGVGTAILATMRRLLRLRLSARVRRYRDAKGRVTPWLDIGKRNRVAIAWLHGFSDRPDGFLRTARHLAKDFRIIAPALPAFHQGWRDPEARHTISAFGSWITPLLADAGADRLIVVGNSLGGAVALDVASRSLEGLRGVVAVNSAGMHVEGVPSVGDEIARNQSPFEIRRREDVNELMTRLVGRRVQVPRPFEVAMYREYNRDVDWYLRLGREIGRSKAKETGNGWKSAVALSEVSVPALVLWGVRDTLFPTALAEKMAELLPQGRLQLLEDIGHCPQFERPRILADAIRSFAESVV